jgi:hypothetical protein
MMSDERAETNRVARLLMAEWERVEGRATTTSYVATFADMARVILRDRAQASAPLHARIAELAAQVTDIHETGLAILAERDTALARIAELEADLAAHEAGLVRATIAGDLARIEAAEAEAARLRSSLPAVEGEGYKNGYAAGFAQGERWVNDALRATVDRVRALMDTPVAAFRGEVLIRDLRAALADPKGEGA